MQTDLQECTRRGILLICCALAPTVLAGPWAAAGSGLERFWTADGPVLSGDFNDPAHWVAGDTLGIPGADDAAIFDVAGQYTVSFSAVQLTDRVLVKQGAVIFGLASQSYTLLNPLSATASIVVADAAGTASLEVTGGSLHGQFADVGRGPGSSGSLFVTGAGAVLVNEWQLRIGFQGAGLLELRQGAAASNGAAAVAVTGGSSGAVLVTDSGTLWDCTGTLAVGKGGSGTMTVVSGAQVTCDDAIVAQELASVGAVLVNGTGSAWTILGSLDVGMTGVGTMTITDGAAVTTDLFATLGTFTGPPFTDEHAVGEAVLDGAGSTLSVGGDLYVGLAGFGRWTLARGGQVIVAGDLVRGEWPEESKLPQTLIELGGAGEYSAAAISAGGAADGFDARVELSGGYVPSFGDTFFIAAAATILDPFTFDLPPLSPPVAWQVIQDATTVRLRVGRLGDLDGDDEVGITDFLSLLKTWGACAPGSFCPADLDGDGEVGVTDLLLLLGAWG